MPQRRCGEEYIVPAEYSWIKSHLRKDPERGKWAASGLEWPEILQEIRQRYQNRLLTASWSWRHWPRRGSAKPAKSDTVHWMAVDNRRNFTLAGHEAKESLTIKDRHKQTWVEFWLHLRYDEAEGAGTDWKLQEKCEACKQCAKFIKQAPKVDVVWGGQRWSRTPGQLDVLSEWYAIFQWQGVRASTRHLVN